MKRRLSVTASLLLLVVAAGCVEMPGCGVGADFSPDGKQIAFTWMSRDGLRLAITDSEGRRMRSVPQSENPGPPLWSPDGKYLLFTTDTDLVLYDPAQQSARKIATEIVPGAYAWSSDGSQIVCLCAPVSKSGDQPARVLWISVPGGEVLMRIDLPPKLEPPSFEIPRVTVACLPATWGIAFIDSGKNLHSVEAGKVYRITRTGDVQSLWVSPDGTQVQWVRSPKGSPVLVVHSYDLNSRTVTGSPVRIDLRRLPHLHGYTVGGALGVLSPDGQRMLVTAAFNREAGREKMQYSAVYLVELASREVRLLRQQKPAKSKESELPLMPFWSHDGSKIAVLALGDESSLWVCRAEGFGGRVIRYAKVR